MQSSLCTPYPKMTTLGCGLHGEQRSSRDLPSCCGLMQIWGRERSPVTTNYHPLHFKTDTSLCFFDLCTSVTAWLSQYGLVCSWSPWWGEVMWCVDLHGSTFLTFIKRSICFKKDVTVVRVLCDGLGQPLQGEVWRLMMSWQLKTFISQTVGIPRHLY